MSADATHPLPYEPAAAAAAASAGAETAGAPEVIRRCAGCGYDLRGLEQPRCPECGLEFDPYYRPPADVPWLNRGATFADANVAGVAGVGSAGAFVAYWRTVWLVLLRPREFGAMVWADVDVDAADAARFRWITIGVAVGSVLATLLPVLAPLRPTATTAAVTIALLLALCAPLVAFFWMATARFDIIHFTAHWFTQEQRYRRLHEMSCAGLALAPLVPVTLFAGLIFGWRTNDVAFRSAAAAVLVLAAWWYGSLRYQVHGGRCRPGDAVLHAAFLPLTWCGIATFVAVFTLGIAGLVVGLFR